MSICFKCNRNLGFFSIKHKTLDGNVVCDTCFNILKKQEALEEGLITQEENGMKYEKLVTAKDGEEIVNIPITCPNCNESFDVEIDFSKADKEDANIDTSCPYCGTELKGSIRSTGVTNWSCDYCGKEFPSKEENEEHEKECKYRI